METDALSLCQFENYFITIYLLFSVVIFEHLLLWFASGRASTNKLRLLIFHVPTQFILNE